MEREYNRNQRSYRPRRNDSREDYQSGNNERENYGARRERREFNAGSDERRRSPRSFDRREDRPFRPFERREDRPERPFERRSDRSERSFDRREDRPTRFFERREDRPERFSPRRESRPYSGPRRNDEEVRKDYKPLSRRPRISRQEEQAGGEDRGERRTERREYGGYANRRENFRKQEGFSKEAKEQLREKHYSKKKILTHRLKNEDENAELRLNRYISMGGVCSRRDADELIVAGRVKVNGVVMQVVGQKVRRSDTVEVDDVRIIPERKVYLVLNKPKDYVTTLEDPLERKTVMSLVEDACKERIYPVGRLDRQTTGVLLFTNDGDFAKKLTHPKYEQKKIYHVFLDKPLEEKDLEAISSGIDLEDGFIKADEIEYVSADAMEVGIEIHSGKNRIVRRIFEHLGYQIVKLDRVYFAGITKKNIPRGKWRFLTQREVSMLKAY